ncbi:response regulator transcription factor [Saprospira sp. CCB-QB6]|uniref:response regulator transcription factor n=1 Tax=Saprospira sp. CCB-QB6 TaxID=3023936 RepID=UPI00234908BB|nr:response regulator transcription factor [Saprospira sp. CCB-QB6]WCL82302.1 response regulator transcription factor [Saprospira sp. CCB-QB6]
MSQLTNINIAITDDDSLVVQLLTEYLEKFSPLPCTVSLTANSGQEFIEKTKLPSFQEVDIILLDMRMKDGDGLWVLEQLNKQQFTAKIIVLTSYYKTAYIGQMMSLGAHAFLPKEIDKEQLVEIMEEVHKKGHYFTSEQMQSLRAQITAKSPKLQLDPTTAISPRELEVLQLIAQQYTTKEIAEKLCLTVKTIEAHKSNLLSKTGSKNAVGLVVYAIEQGLIKPSDCIRMN